VAVSGSIDNNVCGPLFGVEITVGIVKVLFPFTDNNFTLIPLSDKALARA
jgi:hypothetical protein